MSPHDRQLITQLASLRHATHVAELEAIRWAAQYELLGGAYFRRQFHHALHELRFCERDLENFENKLLNSQKP
jgi:hypothetical protein